MPMALGYKDKYLKQKTTYHRPVDESYGYVDESYGYVDESYGYVDESYGYGSHIYTGLSKRLLCTDRMIL
jgi:hypothetical protein